MNEVALGLIRALGWEAAHVGFERATQGLTVEDISIHPPGHEFNIWQLAEHIRIAQSDILEFCVNPDYVELKWPDEYWPTKETPDSIEEWEHCLSEVKRERQMLVNLVKKREAELFEPFSHGNGQTLFREVLLVIDHEAYHTGQLVQLRKVMGRW